METLIEFLFGTNQIYFIAPLVLGAGLAAAGSAAGSWLNSQSQRKTNKQSMAFQRDMWNRTNQYNTPKAQMSRLKSAGLNPNLVYGGSSGATAGEASMQSAPSMQAPQYGDIVGAGIQGVSDVYQIRQQKAGIDVQEEQAKNIKQSTINSAIDSIGKTISNNKNMLSLKQKRQLFQTEIDTVKANLENINASTEKSLGENRRAEQITQATLPKLREELKYLRKKGKVLNEELIMKTIDRKIQQETGMRPHDPHYYRVLQKLREKADSFFPDGLLPVWKSRNKY